jgi:uncharacterized protein YegP (UPF0339 family)
MAGLYEIKKSKNGQYHFVLKASNGEVILQSEHYKTKTSAKKGIASVQKNSGSEARFVKKDSKSGKPFFVLRAGNNQVIGTSELYETARARDNGIASVSKNGQTNTIKDDVS